MKRELAYREEMVQQLQIVRGIFFLPVFFYFIFFILRLFLFYSASFRAL